MTLKISCFVFVRFISGIFGQSDYPQKKQAVVEATTEAASAATVEAASEETVEAASEATNGSSIKGDSGSSIRDDSRSCAGSCRSFNIYKRVIRQKYIP
ncbi:hypothetical protein F8M41_009527 [Gigaspora margarita]|uniref:Secreted protein n=1 Tax=Gigaspora margarita TaxID=4874 RepID=A0A8H4EQG7_GIGMA|nr:hypothetical protein F8M41_009527 [Gigaspora margarita]